MTQTPPPSQQPADGLKAPEYYALKLGGEFVVTLPDDTLLKITTPEGAVWEIKRYDAQQEREAFDRVIVQRRRVVEGEQAEPMKPYDIQPLQNSTI